MIDFFYDSLETLKTVKTPTSKELFQFTIAVIVTLIIAGALFLALDAASGSLYQMLYNMFTA